MFLAATTGADLIARTSIGGQPFVAALHEHLYWAGVQFVGTMLLLAPFVAVAFVCAFVEKQAQTRSVLLIFAVAMLTLLYFYFQGHQAAERFALQKMWDGRNAVRRAAPVLQRRSRRFSLLWARERSRAKFDRRMSA